MASWIPLSPLKAEGAACLSLTFSHGLEVHLPAIATVPCHGTCPHLENVDGASFEGLHGHRVGEALHCRRV